MSMINANIFSAYVCVYTLTYLPIHKIINYFFILESFI
jgi:hypothetical protein